MPKKNTTIEDLAVMVKRGFDEVTGTMARKKDVDERFDKVEERLENIEKLMLKQHSNEMEIRKLEKRVKKLESLLVIK